MSTRRLIAAALACGVAILVAGSVWVFQASRSGADPAAALAVGQAAPVAGAVVAVEGGDAGPDGLTVAVSVSLEPGQEPVAPEQGWILVRARGAEGVGAEAGPDCPVSVAGGETVRCRLLFAVSTQPDEQLVVVHGRGDESASWLVS